MAPAGTGATPLHLLVLLLLMLFVQQLNRRLQFLKIKILLVSFSPAVNVGDNLLVEFNAPSINLLAILESKSMPQLKTSSLHVMFQLASTQML